jgi:hypothetical protein
MLDTIILILILISNVINIIVVCFLTKTIDRLIDFAAKQNIYRNDAKFSPIEDCRADKKAEFQSPDLIVPTIIKPPRPAGGFGSKQ